jgi:hypothetical protein
MHYRNSPPTRPCFLLRIVSAASAIAVVGAVAACGESGRTCDFFCPGNNPIIQVAVPSDRASDVGAVTATGPCSSPTAAQGGAKDTYYDVHFTGTGMCHITVSFLSGAPSFTVDVKITPNPGLCCAGPLVAEPSVVAVPESGLADAATDN